MAEFEYKNEFSKPNPILTIIKDNTPDVYILDHTEWNSLSEEIDQLNNEFNINLRENDLKDIQKDSIKYKSYFSDIAQDDGINEQISLLESIKQQELLQTNVSEDDEDNTWEKLLNDPFIYEDKIPIPNQVISSNGFIKSKRYYNEMVKSTDSIQKLKPPSNISLHTITNYASGISLGAGFYFGITYNNDFIQTLLPNSIYNYLLGNVFSGALTCATIGIQFTDDLQKVLFYGESWERIPRNLIGKVLQSGIQSSSCFLLVGILAPLSSTIGISGLIGFAIVKLIVNKLTQKIDSLIVEKIMFKSKLELEWTLANEVAQRNLENEREYQRLRNEAIKEIKLKQSGEYEKQKQKEENLKKLWNTLSILKKPWEWSKKNSTTIITLGVSYSIYNMGKDISLVNEYTKSFKTIASNSAYILSNSIATSLVTSLQVAKTVKWFLTKIKMNLNNSFPNLKNSRIIKSLDNALKKIGHIIGTEINVISLTSAFTELLVGIYAQNKAIQYGSIDYLESLGDISSKDIIYNAFEYWEKIKEDPKNILLFSDYLSRIPFILKDKEPLFQLKNGILEQSYKWDQTKSSYIDNNGNSIKLNDLETKNDLYISRNGITKRALILSEIDNEWFNSEQIDILQLALKNGFPIDKFNELIGGIKENIINIEKLRINSINDSNKNKEIFDKNDKIITNLNESLIQLNNEIEKRLNEGVGIVGNIKSFLTGTDIENIKLYNNDPLITFFRNKVNILLKDNQFVQNQQELLSESKNINTIGGMKLFIQKNLNDIKPKLEKEVEKNKQIFNDSQDLLNQSEELLKNFLSKKLNYFNEFNQKIGYFNNPEQVLKNIEGIYGDRTINLKDYNLNPSNNTLNETDPNIYNHIPNQDNAILQERNVENLKGPVEELKTQENVTLEQKVVLEQQFMQNANVYESVLNYELKNAQTYELSLQIQQQLDLLKKYMNLFGSNGTLLQPLGQSQQNEFNKLRNDLEGKYKSKIDQLNDKNQVLSKNCILSSEGWKVQRDINGINTLVDKNGLPVDKNCIYTPFFSLIYKNIRGFLSSPSGIFLSTKNFFIFDKLFNIVLTAFEESVIQYGRSCQNNKNENDKKLKAACLINRIFLTGIIDYYKDIDPLKIKGLDDYAFVDPREILLKSSPQVQNVLEIISSGNILTQNGITSDLVSELDSNISPTLDYFGILGTAKTVYEYGSGIGNLLLGPYGFLLTIVKIVSNLYNFISDIIKTLIDAGVFADVAFGSKGLSSLRNEYDNLMNGLTKDEQYDLFQQGLLILRDQILKNINSIPKLFGEILSNNGLKAYENVESIFTWFFEKNK